MISIYVAWILFLSAQFIRILMFETIRRKDRPPLYQLATCSACHFYRGKKKICIHVHSRVNNEVQNKLFVALTWTFFFFLNILRLISQKKFNDIKGLFRKLISSFRSILLNWQCKKEPKFSYTESCFKLRSVANKLRSDWWQERLSHSLIFCYESISELIGVPILQHFPVIRVLTWVYLSLAWP